MVYNLDYLLIFYSVLNLMIILIFFFSFKDNNYLLISGLWITFLINFLVKIFYPEDVLINVLAFSCYYINIILMIHIIFSITKFKINLEPFNIILVISLVITLLLYQFNFMYPMLAIPIAISIMLPVIVLLYNVYCRHVTIKLMNKVFISIVILNTLHLMNYPFLRFTDVSNIGFFIEFLFMAILSVHLPLLIFKNKSDDHITALNEEISVRHKIEIYLQKEKSKVIRLLEVNNQLEEESRWSKAVNRKFTGEDNFKEFNNIDIRNQLHIIINEHPNDIELNIDSDVPESIFCDTVKLINSLHSIIDQAFSDNKTKITLDVYVKKLTVNNSIIYFTINDIYTENKFGLLNSITGLFNNTGLGVVIYSKVMDLMQDPIKAYSSVPDNYTDYKIIISYKLNGDDSITLKASNPQ